MEAQRDGARRNACTCLGNACYGTARPGRVDARPARIVAASGFDAKEIDRAFYLLVTSDGFAVGGQAEIADLDGFRIGALVLDGMIEIADDGQWTLTERGAAFSDLLTEYARPQRQWRLTGDRESITELLGSEWGGE